MSTPTLTPTSYALLGLLAIRPWTTYELAQQMDRTLSRFWPRARSKLYEEPKKLAAAGLAKASDDSVGRRRRTVYSITPKGRGELASWVGRPGEGPVLEYEQLMQVFFATSGTTDDIRRCLQDMRAWVDERTTTNIDVARSYLDGDGPFPERAAVNLLVGRFLDDFLETIDRWAEWAEGVVDDWPEDPGRAAQDRVELERSLRQAVARSKRWRASRARHG